MKMTLFCCCCYYNDELGRPAQVLIFLFLHTACSSCFVFLRIVMTDIYKFIIGLS